MYRYSNGQISLSDFKQPVGMNLKENNRWVKKAKIIPWLEIEKRYAALFKNRNGNVAKPLQLALGACLVQAEYGYSDEEVPLQIQENPYLQYFCGYTGYDDEHMPFDPSLMVYFRKRLTPEVLGEINELILKEAKKAEAAENSDHNDDGGNGGGDNKGTLILDATCAPVNIRFPQDVSLLDEAREKAEAIIDECHKERTDRTAKKPRTYREKAHKSSLRYMRSRKHTEKKTRGAIREQLQYLRRDLGIIQDFLNSGTVLNARQLKLIETLQTVYDQQKYMYDNRTHSVPNRIVSIHEPFIRPIVRGKAGKPVEFGPKLDISVADGWTRLEYYSFDAYNESAMLQDSIERYRVREDHYPELVLADKIYRNRDNPAFCKARGIRLSGPALGRPKKDEPRNKKQDYLDQNDRIEIERQFSLAKRKCNLGKVMTKREDTIGFTLAMSIVVLNLRKIQRATLYLFDLIFSEISPNYFLGVIQ